MSSFKACTLAAMLLLYHGVSGKDWYNNLWGNNTACVIIECNAPVALDLFECYFGGHSCSCGDAYARRLAQCIGSRCPDDVSAAYWTFTYNCRTYSSSQFGLPWDDFLAIANEAKPPSSSSSVAGARLSPVKPEQIASLWAGYPDCSVVQCAGPESFENPQCFLTRGCTCKSVNFWERVSACMGVHCSKSDAETVYNIADDQCGSIGSGFTFSLDDFLDVYSNTTAAFPRSSSGSTSPGTTPPTATTLSPVKSSSTSRPPATISPSSPSSPANTPTVVGSGGLSQNDKIALGVGITVPLFCLSVSVYVAFLLRR